MKACTTNIARSMGYIGGISNEERQYQNPVSIMGPKEGKMTSYHAGGKSAGEQYRENWRKAKCVMSEFRL